MTIYQPWPRSAAQDAAAYAPIDPRGLEEIAQLSQAAERALNAHLDSHGDVWDVCAGPCQICLDLADLDQRLWDRLEAMGTASAPPPTAAAGAEDGA